MKISFIMNEDYGSFDEWFDSFVEHCYRLGYSGPIDPYTFESDYEEGKYPDVSAEEFVKEMNS